MKNLFFILLLCLMSCSKETYKYKVEYICYNEDFTLESVQYCNECVTEDHAYEVISMFNTCDSLVITNYEEL